MAPKPRVAIVTDWLTSMGGAEPTILKLHELFPDAPIYTSVYDKEKMTAFADCDIRTTYLQWLLPKFLRYKHVLWPVLRAFAFRSLDLSGYDVIISSASAEAKAVRKPAGAIHICYCHTPIRYYWSHYKEFKQDFNFGALTPLIRPTIPFFVRWMRKKDLASVAGIDYFIANSHETQARIKNYYHRNSTVIFPPVQIARFARRSKPWAERQGYCMWSRHVPYKRFDLAIQACNQLKLQLTIAGTGPETERLKKMSGPTIKFIGRAHDADIEKLAGQSKAFLFPGDEDFGITPVEAQAAGTPTIAYGKGGALDYVIPGKTGILFASQTVASLVQALQQFERMEFNAKEISRHAEIFSEVIFVNKIKKFVASCIKK